MTMLACVLQNGKTPRASPPPFKLTATAGRLTIHFRSSSKKTCQRGFTSLLKAAAGADHAGNCSCSCGEGCGEGCGERAVSSRRARRARDTVVGRPAPHARWSPVGQRDRPGPLDSQGQHNKGPHTRMRFCCLYICCSLFTVCVFVSD